MCKMSAGLFQESAKLLVSMENILGRTRSCWMLLEKKFSMMAVSWPLIGEWDDHSPTHLSASPSTACSAQGHCYPSCKEEGTDTGKKDPTGSYFLALCLTQ